MGMLAPPTDDLIERVKSNAILRWRLEGLKGDIVDYAIAIALEEAAKHFDEMWGGSTPDEVAGIIRALIKD